jgi:thioredoxin 1
MESDPELDAIRARLRAEMMTSAQPAAAAVDHPLEVTDAEFASFVKRHDVVVIDCWASWCGPCRMIAPSIDALAREMAGRVVFGKLDADENPRVMEAFGIMGIPTLLVFKGGKLVDRLVGALPKAQIAAAIARHAAA